MTDSVLFEQSVDVVESSVAKTQLVQQNSEAILKSSSSARLIQQNSELAARSVVANKLFQQDVEAVQADEPSVVLAEQYVEVLWKESPTPEILPWRQNWETEIKETLQWKTEVIISRDGSERRAMLRNRPRRSLFYKFTLSDNSEALGFLNWCNYNLGKKIIAPILHQQLRMFRSFSAGETFIFDDDGISPLYLSNLQPIENSSMTFGARDFMTINEGEILIIDRSGNFQRYYAIEGSSAEGNGLTLKEKLAREISINSLVFPATEAIIKQPPTVSHVAGNVIEATMSIEASSPIYSYLTDGNWISEESNGSVPLILGWYSGNDWADPIELGFDPLIESSDNDLAKPFNLRVNERSNYTLTRRFYAVGEYEIFLLRGMMDYLSGRLRPVYIDEQVHGITLKQSHTANSNKLFVENDNLATWLGGTKLLLARNLDGNFCIIKVASIQSIDHNTCEIILAELLPIDIDKDAVITRLLFARLQHDSVEMIYRTDKLVETNFTFQVLEEPVLDTQISNNYWVPRECEGSV